MDTALPNQKKKKKYQSPRTRQYEKAYRAIIVLVVRINLRRLQRIPRISYEFK